MTKPDLRDTFEYNGVTIGLDWFDIVRKDDLPDVHWQQVHAIANLDGGVPVVIYGDGHATLPGGRTEPGEAIDQTISRELMEELNCRTLNWEPIGYQKLSVPGEDEPVYQLRVYAEIEKNGEFENDPGGNVIGYMCVKLAELNMYIRYGKVGERIIELVTLVF